MTTENVPHRAHHRHQRRAPVRRRAATEPPVRPVVVLTLDAADVATLRAALSPMRVNRHVRALLDRLTRRAA